MYVWKNEKLRNQYDIQRMVAKNNGVVPYSDEELSITNIKSKPFSDITDTKVKRLVELAYILGTLGGLKTADGLLEETKKEVKQQSENVPVKNEAPVLTDKLYILVCKAKNRQDKIVYVTHAVKAHSETDAVSAASFECGKKNQTLLQSKVVISYGSDTMQFQFGIGQKEKDTILAANKKYLK